MGNPVRGIVDVDAGGKAVRLQFTANAICDFEDREKTGFVEFLAKLDAEGASGKVRLSDMRKLIWAGMIEHQPEATLRDAGAIIDALGGPMKATDVLRSAIAAALPESEDAGASAPGNAAAA